MLCFKENLINFSKHYQPIEAKKLNKILFDFIIKMHVHHSKRRENVRLRQTKQLIKTNNDVTIMGLVNDLSFHDDL